MTAESRQDLFVRFETDPGEWSDEYVETVALHRILRADFVYVVAPDGYVGRTTCYEIGRVLQANRALYFSEKPTDLPVTVPDDWIAEPVTLVRRFRAAPPLCLIPEDIEHARLERALSAGEWFTI